MKKKAVVREIKFTTKKRIGRIRKDLGITTEKFASLLKVPVMTYRLYESGACVPREKRRNQMILKLKQMGYNFREVDF